MSKPDRQRRTCHMKKSPIVAAATVAMVIGTTVAVTSAVNASTSSASSTGDSHRAKPVRIEVFAPERGANAGASGFGWFVDMEVDFLGKNLHQAGFSGLQLTGPAGDTWIVGAPIAGQNVDTTLTVAVIDDLNHDGIFNDAPNVVPDLNNDGSINAKDLKLLGVASNIVTVPFRINGDPAQP